MAKRDINLRATSQFLVDTLRPRKVHPPIEGFRRRGTPKGLIMVLAVIAGVLAAVWLLQPPPH